MYKRSLAPILERFSKIYPIISITGPRQSGKTILARSHFPHLPYVSFENFDVQDSFRLDPRAFLNKYKAGAIFDEAQHVPELFSYLQGVVDDSPETGRYVVTGSQNFLLNEKITQSLAGRIGVTKLLPLSLEELGMLPDMNKNIFKGGYPRLYDKQVSSEEFFPSYIHTYVERDVRQITNIENLSDFQTFMKLCAGRVGQLLNITSLAQDCGISSMTARRWLSILEASYIIFFLQPFYKNFSKRLTKMPKIYFCDTGLACHLLGMETESQVGSHYLKGALYENMVILEILKGRLNQAKAPNLYFWRDKTGYEVDLIGEWGGKIKAIEIKSGTTFQPEFIKNIRYFYGLSQKNAAEAVPVQSYLIYGGDYSGELMQTKLVPFGQMNTVLQD